jgi:hypothetical protein
MEIEEFLNTYQLNADGSDVLCDSKQYGYLIECKYCPLNKSHPYIPCESAYKLEKKKLMLNKWKHKNV